METNRFWDEMIVFAPKIYERQILRKITHQKRNEHITMCP